RLDRVEHEHTQIQQRDGDRGGDDRGLGPLQPRSKAFQIQAAGSLAGSTVLLFSRMVGAVTKLESTA
ncbi:hypothetical protein, partial [Mycobacterium sp.]|uniref:hypothetical protein n=1 Tax=Mycobacterium sp. TaxID=1785 RepID=UPI00333FB326